jgi:hypothetical protein
MNNAPGADYRNTEGGHGFFRAGVRPATELICHFIDQGKDDFGVVPVCRALSVHGIQIAPRTYWAYLSHAPSKRELWDAAVTEIMAGIYERGENGRRPESMYGTLKMWEYLQRQGIPVAKCTVGRLKNENDCHGRTRARGRSGRLDGDETTRSNPPMTTPIQRRRLRNATAVFPISGSCPVTFKDTAGCGKADLCRTPRAKRAQRAAKWQAAVRFWFTAIIPGENHVPDHGGSLG